MKKFVRILKMPECGRVVIGDRTLKYSVGDIVDVSEDDQEDILNLIKENVLEEVSEEEAPH